MRHCGQHPVGLIFFESVVDGGAGVDLYGVTNGDAAMTRGTPDFVSLKLLGLFDLAEMSGGNSVRLSGESLVVDCAV